MATMAVDETTRDQIVASDGILTGIVMTSPPSKYEPDSFCLVDRILQPPEVEGGDPTLLNEVPVFNLHISSSAVSSGSVLMSGGTLAFSNLAVKSIPEGCSFDLTTEDQPTQQESDE